MIILSARDLDKRHWRAWLAFHQGDPELDSPYFHPEFVRGLVEVGREVSVAIVEDAGEVLALYPFEREGPRGRPAGWPMCDYQAPICAPGYRFDISAFMRTAGIQTHLFDHMLASRLEFTGHVECVRPSPYLHVTGGLEGYKSRLSDIGRKTLSDTLRFGRKAAREVGELRFEFRSQDTTLLETLFAWKSRQYIKRGADDFFGDWQPRRYLLNLLRRSQDPEFSGALSALWAGDELLALHMGMRARGVLHWWFPVYHPKYSAYSPGRIMLAKLAEAAPMLGLTKIDLGKGEEAYKLRCMTGATQLAEGCIETRALHRWWRRQHLQCMAALRNSPPYELARKWKRKLTGGKRSGG